MKPLITESTTAREIATRWPNVIPRLEALRIDYCCGGARPIGEAAAAAGVDAASLIEELRNACDAAGQAPDETDWSAVTMTELADHIEATHHAYVRATLDRLAQLMPRIVEAHAEDDQRSAELGRVVAAFTDDMHDHMVREERVLFPWLRRLEKPTEITSGPPWSVRRPIDCMLHDHDDAAEALAAIRRLTDDHTPPVHACPTLREAYRLLAELEADTHLHIHKENNILFPAGVRAESQRAAQEERRRRAAAAAGPGFTLVELLVVVAVVALLLLVAGVAIRTSGLF